MMENSQTLAQEAYPVAKFIFGRELTSSTKQKKRSNRSNQTHVRRVYLWFLKRRSRFFVPRVSAPVASHTIDMQQAEWSMCRPTPQSEDDNGRYVFLQDPLRSQARANPSGPQDAQAENDLPNFAMSKIR